MSLLNRLFGKTDKVPVSDLVTDIHSHLLPGIDDGARNVDESIGMLLKFQELGFKKLVLTPHIKSGQFPNTTESIRAAELLLREELEKNALFIEFDVSAEYYSDERFLELIRDNDLLPFAGNHILFECSFHYENPLLHETVAALKAAGYRPVLAHFERYSYYHGSVEVARELRRVGCDIQINLLSLLGHYGPEIQRQSRLLVEAGEFDFTGSDCHRIQHLHKLEEGLSDKWLQLLLTANVRNKTVFE